jgi:hypothetical protein
VNNSHSPNFPDNFISQPFEERIYVHHSATAMFYAPSELCGSGGLICKRIYSLSSFHGNPCHDTMFVEMDGNQPGFFDRIVACVLLFFSFEYQQKSHSCALVHWFVHDKDVPDQGTTMWEVQLEHDKHNHPLVEVISVDSIIHAAHLLPVYGHSHVLEHFSHGQALDCYKSFFVNHFSDHHTHELITG